jgi:hypothetical protein
MGSLSSARESANASSERFDNAGEIDPMELRVEVYLTAHKCAAQPRTLNDFARSHHTFLAKSAGREPSGVRRTFRPDQSYPAVGAEFP